MRREILGDSDDSGGDDDNESEDDEGGGGANGSGDGDGTQLIQDLTEQDLVNLRRTIYLAIMSSAAVRRAIPMPRASAAPPRSRCASIAGGRVRAQADQAEDPTGAGGRALHDAHRVLRTGANLPPILRSARRALLSHRKAVPGRVRRALCEAVHDDPPP